MGNDVDRAVQRTRQYWYDDGLAEIATGCILMIIGLLFIGEARAVILSGASSIGLVIVVTGGFLLARRAVAIAKARLTYPRTGYVRYARGSRRSKGLAGGVAAVMAFIVAMLFATAPASLTWIPALDGLMIGGFLLYLGHNLGISRFYAMASLSAAIGAAISLSGMGDILGSGIYFGAMGLTVILSGALALRSYLRGTETSEGE